MNTISTGMTQEQSQALMRLINDRTTRALRLIFGPFDLPAGYILVEFYSGFTCGVAPDGAVSS